jgi:hypothetical protein
VIGLICLLALIASVSSDFRTRAGVSEEMKIEAPPGGRLIVKIGDTKPVFYESDWMGIDWFDHAPFFDITEDSLTVNTVRIDIVKSNDSAWHLRREKLSRGNTTGKARDLASRIDVDMQQKDSVLYLPAGFSIKPGQQFRNQQVLVVIEMPVGKKIRMDRSLEDFHWFDLRQNWRNRGIERDWDDNWNNNYSSWSSDVDYIMTDHGLERSAVNSIRSENRNLPDRDDDPDDIQRPGSDTPQDGYRYHKKEVKKAAKTITSEGNGDGGNISPLILFTRWS